MVIHYDLPELIRGYGGKLPKNLRVYEVVITGVDVVANDTVFVIANSPGQAALETCTVKRVSDKDLVRAAFEAMGVK